jgi:hypothetical protein
MSAQIPIPCPKCGGNISIEPSYGGSRNEMTMYRAQCYKKTCGYVMDHLGSNGTKRSATSEWNRAAKELKP